MGSLSDTLQFLATKVINNSTQRGVIQTILFGCFRDFHQII